MNNLRPSTFDPEPLKRPFSVTLFTLAVLSIAGINLIRFIQAVRLWVFLFSILPISPLYLATTGLIWGSVGLLLAWGLWYGKRWAPHFARLGAIVYVAYVWIQRLGIANVDNQNYNWPFAAGMTLIGLGWTFWIFSRKEARVYFGERYEQSS